MAAIHAPYDWQGFSGTHRVGHTDGTKTFDPDRPGLLTVHNKLLHRDGRHKSDHRHRGLHPYGQAAEIPRRVAPCPRDLTLERRGIGRDLVIENGPRSEDASSSGSGRNDPMHALQLDD
jgi:hypothetical protein